jgi:hypothetical protein
VRDQTWRGFWLLLLLTPQEIAWFCCLVGCLVGLLGCLLGFVSSDFIVVVYVLFFVVVIVDSRVRR